ncbi:Citrate lyase beta subunit OS=Streptomyces albaduncus OX=68172 GN=FHS32_002056 PE=4 SV=1 [Streptomyces griseoloalbus]
MDEPATAKALAGYLLRGLHCGALDDAEVSRASGLTGRPRGVRLARRGGLTVSAP